MSLSFPFWENTEIILVFNPVDFYETHNSEPRGTEILVPVLIQWTSDVVGRMVGS